MCVVIIWNISADGGIPSASQRKVSMLSIVPSLHILVCLKSRVL